MNYDPKLPKKIKRVRNVGELIDALTNLPRSLPIRGSFSKSVRPAIYNNTELFNDPHIMFDEND